MNASRYVAPPVERAMARVIRVGDCWVWPGATVSGGYGGIRVDGRYQLVHRLLWEAVNGPVPAGRELGHRCPDGARPDCVNPGHIEAMTHSENMLDRFGGKCLRGLHDFAEPGVSAIEPSTGKRHCRPCRNAYLRATRAGRRSHIE